MTGLVVFTRKRGGINGGIEVSRTTTCFALSLGRFVQQEITAEDVLEELSRNKENVHTQNLGLSVEEAEHSISNASTNDEGSTVARRGRVVMIAWMLFVKQ